MGTGKSISDANTATVEALRVKLGMLGTIAGSFSSALPTGTIATDKMYVYTGTNATLIGGITWYNGDYAIYNGSTWSRVPFQSLANYFKKSETPVYDLTTSLSPGTPYNLYTAVRAVSAPLASLGMRIKFLDAASVWKTYQYVGASIVLSTANFWKMSNWVEVLTPSETDGRQSYFSIPGKFIFRATGAETVTAAFICTPLIKVVAGMVIRGRDSANASIVNFYNAAGTFMGALFATGQQSDSEQLPMTVILTPAMIPAGAVYIRCTGVTDSGYGITVPQYSLKTLLEGLVDINKSAITTNTVGIQKINNKIFPALIDTDYTNEIAGIVNLNTSVTFDSVTKIGTFAAVAKWAAGVFAPNGKIYCIPNTATTVLEINPEDGSYCEFGNLPAGTYKWTGGAVADDGMIYCYPRQRQSILKINPFLQTCEEIPITSTLFGTYSQPYYSGAISNNKLFFAGLLARYVGIFDIDTQVYSETQVATGAETRPYYNCYGMVAHPNGKLYSFSGTGVNIIDPSDNSIRTVAFTPFTSDLFYGCVDPVTLNIYITPGINYDGIYKFDILAETITKLHAGVIFGFYGLDLGINGKMYGVPGNGDNIIEFNPSDDTYSVKATLAETGVTAKCAGGVMDLSGNIWCVPAFGQYIYKIVFSGYVSSKKISKRVLGSRYFAKY